MTHSSILATIDVGSNAIRLLIARVNEHLDVHVLYKTREAIRLGQDVFDSGSISPENFERAKKAFVKFHEQIKKHGVEKYQAVGTSALREANNQDQFIRTIKDASGIQIEVIDGQREGQLIYSAITHKLDLNTKTCLLMDIGGGSVELTMVDHGQFISTQSFPAGTVRLLQMKNKVLDGDRQLNQVLGQVFPPMDAFIQKHIKQFKPDVAIGTGGNFETLGKLRISVLHKTSIYSLSTEDLEKLNEILFAMTFKERVQLLKLREDRADVILPAAKLTLKVMKAAQTEILKIPYIGLKEGLIYDLASRLQ